ncbi:ArnT family glycosyltransferase [Actinosynnema mirum]|uniref:Glycosyl transferase family 39 n=1 Tax=Actinosynnema mirum (strain ATCC 29888 / DSM 43827 / JCM 3225 / NBRC 14064 / NCIMB 13271 / NRRL B-12336 / IMRU 3971 / 101) TaxID=446462 RepID=C6WCQ3_ACTMD|nr:glycosyltransferase family 39 protein [Actinosynnema mirum]ACU35670.1 glycosyl transferase family 39 [Actinosynnema mirum DSM 43827]
MRSTRAAIRPHLPLLVLLLGTAVLYLYRLGDSGWANAYYSAAAQAGATSWKAWFFGSSDASNAITVDKTPASLWFMGLSARLFGVNAWAVLVPQALMGVGSVWLLHATVKRTSGEAAGLLAGAVLALTPVAVLMFRFNNPDALLVLTLVAAAYCAVRATESASWRWLALAGVAVGLGFLAKMLQAFLVLPALGLVYLLAAPTTWGRKALHLTGALGAVVVAGGWWVLAVELVPASERPYIGGSQGNSVLELALGYNGLGRLTGDEVGSVGGGAGGGWGGTGWARLLGSEMGGQIAWLLPTAVILLIAGWWAGTRGDRVGLGLWGGWLLVTGGVFSFMNGIIHAYYTVALAPAIGGLVGTGAVALWRRREDPVAAAALSGAVAVTALQCYLLLLDWSSPLAIAVLVLGLVAAIGLFLPRVAPVVVVVPVALVAVLLGPGAYSVATAATPHSGAIPSAGPAGAGMGGMPGGGGPGGGGQGDGGRATRQGTTGGQSAGVDGAGRGDGGARQGGAGMGGGGGMGGLLNAPTPGAGLTALLQEDAASYDWPAAVIGSNNAAGYQLAAGVPVMALGGFNGTDPAPTLERFQQHVADGRVHYLIAAQMMRGESGSDDAHRIGEWVAENFTAATVDGATVYDLTARAQR